MANFPTGCPPNLYENRTQADNLMEGTLDALPIPDGAQH